MLTETVESLKVWGGKSGIWFVKFSKGEIQNYVDFFCQNQLSSTVKLGAKELFGHPKVVP